MAGNDAFNQQDAQSQVLWHDRKRTLFGLPLSFTTYRLTSDRLFVETGFLHKREDEVRLYRVLDLTLDLPLSQRIFGVGSIICDTSDASARKFRLGPVKEPRRVKELLSQEVEKARSAARVTSREYMGDADEEFMGL